MLPLRAAAVYHHTRSINDCLSVWDITATHWVVECDGVDVACASLYRQSRTVAGVPADWRLARLGVLPGYRRRGIGTALVRARLDAVARNGGVWAWASARLSLVALYERLGAIPDATTSPYPVPGTGLHRDIRYGPLRVSPISDGPMRCALPIGE